MIGKSLHPIWNEVFSLEADNPDKDRVRIICYDHDTIGKDDALGEANINLAGLFAGVEQDLWLPLTLAGKNRGNLHVSVRAVDFGKPGGVQQVTTVTQTGAPGGYPAPAAPGYGAVQQTTVTQGYPAPAPGGYPPQPGYGAPAPAPGGYPPQPGYGAPAPVPGGYPPQPGYGAPAPGGYPPQPGYGAPAPGYGAPAPGYPPQPGYGAPAPGYPPQPAYGVQQTTVTQYGAAPAYGARPAYGYGAPPPVIVHHGKPKKYKYKMKLGKALGFKKFKW